MQAKPMTIADEEPPTLAWLAGYRVLRRLGSGSRASVYLGHAGESGERVAIKAFEPFVTADSLDAEIDALSAVSSPYVVRMLDLAIAPGRPRCVVLQRLAGGSLAALLARSPALTAGAAVTVLVCVARGLDALHAAGFDHTNVSPGTVLFDDSGRPVLAGLGHAVRMVDGTGPPGTGAQRGQAGLIGLARLTRTLFDHVEDENDGARAEELARWLEQRGVHRPAEAIEDRLFDLAEPQPVLHPADGSAAQPSRSLDQVSSERESRSVRAALGRLRVSAAPAGRRGAAHVAARDGPPRWARAVELRLALLHGIRRRRRPVVVAGAIGGALLVLALALLPVGGHAPGTAARPGSPAAVAPSREAPGNGGRGSSAPTTGTRPPRTAPQDAAIRADEPIAATEALLALRRACLRTTSPACLEGVDQRGSPMLEADRSSLAGNGPAETYDGYEASLIQRSGGSALVALAPPAGAETAKPASALVIEGETGWRLREVFAD